MNIKLESFARSNLSDHLAHWFYTLDSIKVTWRPLKIKP